MVMAMLLSITACQRLIDHRQGEASPAQLAANDHAIRTRHSLRYRVVLPRDFQVTAVDNRRDHFNGHPFDISRAALIGPNAAVMVHAETVADGSGASNYEQLPLEALDGQAFHVRPRSCQNLSRADIVGESDLEWLSAQGFPPIGPLAVAQYLGSSADHNAEVVLTLMVRVPTCSPAITDEAINGLRNRVSIR